MISAVRRQRFTHEGGCMMAGGGADSTRGVPLFSSVRSLILFYFIFYLVLGFFTEI